MIDAYFATRGAESDNKILEGFEPSQAIVDARIINPGASELTVIFPPWHGERMVTRVLERRVSRYAAVLAYDLHDHILEPNIPGVIATYESMTNRIAEQVGMLRTDRRYSAPHLIGISLGNVALSMTAAKLMALNEPDPFSRVTSVVPGSNLALSMWDGMRTQGLRETFERQGVTRDQLDEAWAGLAPSHHAPAMQGRDVCVHLSTTDGFIPTQYGEEYITALNDAGANVEVRRSTSGHVVSIVKFCLIPSDAF